MTIKTPTQEQMTAALGNAGKAALTGLAGGPIGAVAGGLLALASDLVPAIFSTDSKPALSDAAAFITKQPTEAAQVEALTKDPAATEQFRLQCLQIAADQKKAEQDALLQEQAAIMANALEQQKAQFADTISARDQTVRLAQAGSNLAWGAPIVSVLVLGSFAILAVTVLVRAIPEGNRDIANIMLGYVGGMATAVVSYWVGSSSGSAAKTGVIAGLLNRKGAGVPPSDIS